jgi:hypothetical protein
VGLRIGSLILAVGGFALLAFALRDASPLTQVTRFVWSYSILVLAGAFFLYGLYLAELAGLAVSAALPIDASRLPP